MKKKKNKSSCLSKLEYGESYPCYVTPSPPEPQSREDQDTILGLIASLHLSSDYSDLTIICKDRVFTAHKLVICPRSKYFHRACHAGFKENKHPVSLDDKDPMLIEKLLEYLYTGSYDPPLAAPNSGIPQIDDNVPEMYGQAEGESSQILQIDKAVTDEPEEHIEVPANETVTATVENLPEKLNPANGYAPTYVTEKGVEGHKPEPVIDASVNCHPCYFHLRMYGEADYFMIEDLKSKAERNFCESFINSAETLPFAEIMEEVYSTRANYLGPRQLAIEMIVDNLPLFRNTFTPELMKSIPDFTYDLFQATLDKYVDGSSSMEQNQFRVEFGY